MFQPLHHLTASKIEQFASWLEAGKVILAAADIHLLGRNLQEGAQLVGVHQLIGCDFNRANVRMRHHAYYFWVYVYFSFLIRIYIRRNLLFLDETKNMNQIVVQIIYRGKPRGLVREGLWI